MAETREEALERLFRAHYPDLRRYAAAILRRSGGDPDRAEEAVQEVFVTAWRRINHLMAHNAPEGWLYTTLTLTLKNLLREDRRWEASLRRFRDVLDRPVQPAPGERLELEGFVSQAELDLLRRLYVEGASYRDLCGELGVTKSALAKRIARAKEKFRKNYWESENFLSGEGELFPSAGHSMNRRGDRS